MNDTPEQGTESNATPEIRYLFVRRPIFAAVISIVIVLLGAFALYTLPINRYPPITPPSVQVSATYPGATAEDVAAAVAAPIEEQLSGLDGLLYFKSSNASDGTMNLQVYFDLSRDLDLAAVDVQNQVNLAQPQLPQEAVRQGITITKAQTDILAAIALSSKDPQYDATYLNNYATIYVIDELKRIPGVGDAQGFSTLNFSMLLSLDPDRMAQLGLTVSDVQAAVQEQNTTNPAGRIGREPAPRGNQLTLPVTTLGRLTDPKEFADIIVRANRDGSLVRVKDIGRVTLGSQAYDLIGRVNGVNTAVIRLYLRPGANALNVKKAAVARMNELARNFPAGVTWYLPFDTTPFITASISEVVKTLFEAMALVTLVVFIFLQSWRTTLIPVLAVPVAIIGTFFGLMLLGFEINLLTLFALVLAIGIVVDDAIVVIENVERIMAEENVPPRVAADRAMGQVASALVAIVLSLCAVFLPVAFLSGITGQMYKQFAITLVVAVVISGIVALTLTPALCAVLLKPSQGGASRNRLFGWFNRGFGRVTERYIASVGGVIRRPAPWLACFAVMLVLIAVLVRRVPSGFIPTEDKGYFGLVIQLPDGASLQRTVEVTKRIENYLMKQPAVAYVVNFSGLSFVLGTNQTNAASMFVLLKPWDERTRKQDQLDAMLQTTNQYLASLNDALAFGFNLPEIPGLGTTAGLEVNLQDRSVNDIRKFAGLVNEYTQRANALPEVQGVQSLMRVTVPQIYVHVDREKVKSLGVSLSEVFQTLQTMLSTLYVNDFNLYGRTYRVQLEAQEQFRQTPENIGKLYVRGPDSAMIPVSSLVRTEIQGGPSLVQRFNGFTSALLTGQPKPGYSSGQMLAAVERLADSGFASRGVGYAFSGQSFQEAASGGQGGLIFVFGLVMVFLVLAAQYESWSIPFAVLFGIPFGAFGAFLGVWLRGMASDVYFQIGLLVVVGLAAKNAILIVEFASQLRAQGRSIREAATEAAHERFRPILMTSFAFILGVAPLLAATGAGAQSRHSIGTGVFFGMLTATTIGIFFIPLFYYLIGRLGERGLFRHRAMPPVPAGAGATPSSESDR
jgi:hydrophobe/amphiphile efflux-1 (HAE1) family protein